MVLTGRSAPRWCISKTSPPGTAAIRQATAAVIETLEDVTIIEPSELVTAFGWKVCRGTGVTRVIRSLLSITNTSALRKRLT